MNRRRFLWLPSWVHIEQPTSGLLGLPRLRWGWVTLDEQQWLDIRWRNIVGASVFAIGAVLMALTAGLWCKC